METKRLANFFQQGIELHVVVVVDRFMTHGGHHEPNDARLVGEFLHRLAGQRRIAKGQINHRPELGIGRQYAIGEPPVIGRRQRPFHVELRVDAEVQHLGREHNGIIDGHGFVGPLRQHHVAVNRFVLDLLASFALMNDPAADILKTQAKVAIQPIRR